MKSVLMIIAAFVILLAAWSTLVVIAVKHSPEVIAVGVQPSAR
jgi:hypothetical protein